AVEVDGLGVGGIDRVVEDDHGTGVDDVVGGAGGGAVGGVAVAPDLRGGLGRVGQIGLVAVLRLVVDDDRVVGDGGGGRVGVDRAWGLGLAGVERAEQLGLGEGNVERLDERRQVGSSTRVGDDPVDHTVGVPAAAVHQAQGDRVPGNDGPRGAVV